MGLQFGNRLHIDYSTNNHPTQFFAANDIDCCFMAIFSCRKPAEPRIMRKLWSNLMAELLERTADPTKREKNTEDISREDSKAS